MTVRDESKEQSKDVNPSLLRHPVPSTKSPLIHTLVSSPLAHNAKDSRLFGRSELAGNYFLDDEEKKERVEMEGYSGIAEAGETNGKRG